MTSNLEKAMEQRAQEHDRFLRWRQIPYARSMTTFEQPELMMQFKACQIFSIFPFMKMTFNIFRHKMGSTSVDSK